jgi:NodT family efflux transporter outer membrane factor (OMF) lipoprotein
VTPWRHGCAAIALALAAGCTVGPDYVKPPVAGPAAYKEAPPDSFKDAGDWKRAQPSDQAPNGRWWAVFNDPRLNELEDEVTASNQTLKIAEARFRQARALVGYTRAAEFPSLSVAPGIASVRQSHNKPYVTSTRTTGDFILPFDLSYEVDLWGRIGRSVTAAGEEAQATAADLNTAGLSLHAELALDYFELRAADAQKQLLDDSVKAFAEALQLTEDRANGGAAPESDVAEAKTQLDTTRVQATDVTLQRAQFEHAIAVLIGQPPAAFSLPPLPLAAEPPAIPVGIPSDLLQRRPDIAAAERRLAEANEHIGIAKAAYFPSLIFNAASGFEGTTMATWFAWPSLFWAVGASMSETLFDGGRRNASSQITLAAYDATVANYRQTTLNAFQEVEDNLAALRILDQEAQQQREAVASAKNSLQLSTDRYVGGRDTYLLVINAQAIALANERNETDIVRRRMEASVLLIKALGGGWDASTLPTLDDLKRADGQTDKKPE